MGLRVPDDLAIVSFDDEAPGASAALPLTVAAQPLESLGRTAGRLVVERIEGRRLETARIVLPTTLVIRESRGAALTPPVAEAG
jgi:LacI family transcriptional regulator